jgi:hypothetical protein
MPRCRVCGCTERRTCPPPYGPCWWVELYREYPASALCSACAATPKRGGRWPRPIGWGGAALVSAVLWLAIAGVVWWALTE